ncbi:pentapeptide repeat-containing protein [bacterium]|nr:pentapeptide repeat-containing protein [bacterium]
MKKPTLLAFLFFVLSSFNSFAEVDINPNTGEGTWKINGKIYRVEPYATFRNINTIGLSNFSKANLNRARFINCVFSGVSFDDCNLTDAEFINCEITLGGWGDKSFSKVNFTGAKFTNCKLMEVDFNDCNLTDAEFINLKFFSTCHFADTDISNLTISLGDLATDSELPFLLSEPFFYNFQQTNNRGIPLALPDGWRFESGYIVGPAVDLYKKDLSNINLSGLSLKGTGFSGSDLTNANFDDTDLNEASFNGANITGATFNRAKLNGARDLILNDFFVSQISALATQQLRIQTQVNGNSSNITSINEEINAMKAQLQTLVASIAEKDAEIVELKKRPTLEQVRDARAGSVVLTVDPDGNNITLGLTIEQSDNLTQWTKLDGEMSRTIPIPEGKKFYRFALDK